MERDAFGPHDDPSEVPTLLLTLSLLGPLGIGVGQTAADPVHLQRANLGFPRAEILPGNVGYLDVRQFADPSVGGPTAAAAMMYLGNTEAFVLDLRRSMGGSQAMVALLASWFLDEHPPVHLFDSYHRPSDRTDTGGTGRRPG